MFVANRLDNIPNFVEHLKCSIAGGPLRCTRSSWVVRFILGGGENMLRWAVIFLVIALVAAVFGFTGVAVAAAGIAKFLFFIFLVACLIFFIIGMTAGRRTP